MRGRGDVETAQRIVQGHGENVIYSIQNANMIVHVTTNHFFLLCLSLPLAARMTPPNEASRLFSGSESTYGAA